MTEKKTASKKTPRSSSSKAKQEAADEPVIQEATDAKPGAAPKTSNGILLLVLLVVAAQLGFACYWVYQQQTQPQAITADGSSTQAIDALTTRIDELEEDLGDALDELDALDEYLSQENQLTDLDALEARISELEAQADTIQGATVSDERIDAFMQAQSQLKSLQDSITREQKGQLRLVSQLTALDQIAQNVKQGEPYESSLSALKRTMEKQSELLPLVLRFDAYQSQGAPTMDDLHDLFDEAVEAHYAQHNSVAGTTLSNVLNNLSGLISVRKVGAEHEGDDAASIIARAEAALVTNKLNEAMNEIQSLPSSAKTHFEQWMQAAQDYIALREALTQLRARLIEVADKPVAKAVPEAEPEAEIYIDEMGVIEMPENAAAIEAHEAATEDEE